MYRVPRRTFVDIAALNAVSSDPLNGRMNKTRRVIGRSVGFISLILHVVIEPMQDPHIFRDEVLEKGWEDRNIVHN